MFEPGDGVIDPDDEDRLYELEKEVARQYGLSNEKQFKQEYEARWPTKEEEAEAIAHQEIMERRIRDMKDRYQTQEVKNLKEAMEATRPWSLNLPTHPAISGEIRFPIKNKKIKPFVEELPDGHVSPPLEKDAFKEFVMPIIKQGFPKSKIQDLLEKKPLGTPDIVGSGMGGVGVSGIFDLKTMNQPNTACPLPPGTCETCLGNCVRPGSGDTCGACNGTGMTDEAYKEVLDREMVRRGLKDATKALGDLKEATEGATEAVRDLAEAIPEDKLTTIEQLSADKLEEWIEAQLDSRYIAGSKRPILVDVQPYATERIMDYLIPRFTGWDVKEPELGEKLWRFYCK